VQYLLDCVPARYGGPQAELAIDGIAGPLTVAAICRFQQKVFGRSDGRVDAGGPTIDALAAYDPLPNEPLNYPGAGTGKDSGKGGGTGAGGSGKLDSSSSAKGGSAGDPWGFFNPASPYYLKAGFAPAGAQTQKTAGPGPDDAGGKTGGSADAGGKTSGSAGGGGKSDIGSSADPWGFFNPASPYYMKAGYAPFGKMGKTGGDGGKSGQSSSSGGKLGG
jgi:hypothetical protein